MKRRFGFSGTDWRKPRGCHCNLLSRAQQCSRRALCDAVWMREGGEIEEQEEKSVATFVILGIVFFIVMFGLQHA